jgi:hypothetical protein
VWRSSAAGPRLPVSVLCGSPQPRGRREDMRRPVALGLCAPADPPSGGSLDLPVHALRAFVVRSPGLCAEGAVEGRRVPRWDRGRVARCDQRQGLRPACRQGGCGEDHRCGDRRTLGTRVRSQSACACRGSGAAVADHLATPHTYSPTSPPIRVRPRRARGRGAPDPHRGLTAARRAPSSRHRRRGAGIPGRVAITALCLRRPPT